MYPNTMPPNGAEGEAGHERLVIVVGDNGLTLRFIKNLTERLSYRVIALIKPGPGAQRDDIRREAETNARLRVIERTRITTETITDAGLVEAYAIALMAQDDVGNLHLALEIREMSHALWDKTPPRLVIRMYNRGLRDHIQNLLGDKGVFVESDADMVARTYAAAALQQIPPGDIEIWGRRLYLTRAPHDRAHAQWVIASGSDVGGPVEMITENRGESVRMLCLEAERRRQWLGPALEKTARLTRRTMHTLRSTIQKGLVIAAFLLVGIMTLGMWTLTTYQSEQNPVRDGWDALYILTLLAGGGIDPEMGAPDWIRLTHSVVVLSGSLLIPVVTGAIVQAVVQRRFALSEGRIVNAVRDHVIVAGLGNLGTRVVETLRKRKIPVVAIEKDRNAVGIQAARAAGAQVLLGDASRPETLQEAEIDYCRSLVAMAKQDSANLETVLTGIECRDDLRTVSRIYNPEFAKLVRRNLNDATSPREASRHSSYSAPQVAAASFARALTEDEILETIPVRDRVAYIAEVVVSATSPLDDAAAYEATSLGSHRLLAVRRASGGVRWNPDAAFRLQAGDRLLVLAIRSGLEVILDRCRPGVVLSS
ncbi:NAD-binding protein [Glycomyces sp. L485]|uniref:potassium channel family protein n=1 Tax=Glycomyces sp. L485 TaxID=2909235 RepID=UPI001F4AC4E3|nr:potassium channel protein [Glycomyces sp. L485]MCH7233029.1 NAD-binding protein [Glycomyces sp. L485]